jgi:hypothetical protein
MGTREVLTDVHMERLRQEQLWGEQNHPILISTGKDAEVTRETYRRYAETWKKLNAARIEIQNSFDTPKDRNCSWDGILLEEVFEALAEDEPRKIRAEMVQVAAVAVACIECLDRGQTE